MILNNVKMIGRNEPVNLQIAGGKITGIFPYTATGYGESQQFNFTNALVFPGLINSHDHLDFNLFPQLGGQRYSNYKEWARHIHQNHKDEIAAVLQVPALLRSKWGVYKNLLCGVTTVVNHGESSGMGNELLTVFEQCQCLHSVGFEKNWKLKLNHPFKIKQAAVIHVGEGSDWAAYDEIDQLTRWNLFRKPVIAIHGVAMSEEQAKKFKALVWCPASNYFMFKKTAAVNELKKHTRMLFGTDSVLTSPWNIWDHIRLARKTGLLTDMELYDTLNINAANTWQLNKGEIAEGKDADVVIAKMNGDKNDTGTFFSLNPANLLMVIHQGDIRLFDESLLNQITNVMKGNFSRIAVNGTNKYVQGDLPGTIEEIKKYYPKADIPVHVSELV
jgi:cytosine/adenosine deaminase-related metal-dependent hydrolase